MHPITGSCETNFYTELQEFILLTKMKEVVKIDQNLAIKKNWAHMYNSVFHNSQ